jgi:hypothetical protein
MSANTRTFEPSCVAFAYQEAISYIKAHGRKGSTSCKIGNNTYLGRSFSSSVNVYYHGHSIITFLPGVMRLSPCGFPTKTTKERLNWHTPKDVSVYQSKHLWYLVVGEKRNLHTSPTFAFCDGMMLSQKGGHEEIIVEGFRSVG